ncbi:MAG TPA: hypothetical protein DCS97_00875 [Planctomycetes bacterium]|nr:hypothetical protein [Planctomycetota bacterium]
MRYLLGLPLIALLTAQLAAGEAPNPSGDEVAAVCMLNQLRTDYRRGEAVVLEAIRARTVTITETVWSKSGKHAKSTPPPAVWHPALQIAAAGLLAQGAKLPDKALFDAGPALQQAGYPAAAAGGLVLMSTDAPSLAVAFARACTTIIKVTDKGKYTVTDLAAHEACVETWREIGLAVKTGKSGLSICMVLGKGSAPLLAGGTVYRDANRNGIYDPGEGVVGAVASLGTLRMSTGPGGAWWLAGPAAPGQNLSLAVDGLTLGRPQPAGATTFGLDWNVPATAEIKRLDQLIAEAEKANTGSDEAKRVVPQAALLILARQLSLDDARAAMVPKLIEGVQFRFDNTREKVLEALGESPAEAAKLIAAQKKAWEGAMPEWFKEAAALPKLREQVQSTMQLTPAAAEKPGKALGLQLDKAILSSVEPSFLDLYRTWREQIAAHLASASEPAKKK